MTKRNITEKQVWELVETGELRYKNNEHAWIYKHLNERNDNLICVIIK